MGLSGGDVLMTRASDVLDLSSVPALKALKNGFVHYAKTKTSKRLRYGICIELSVSIDTVVSVLPETEPITRCLSRNLIKIFNTGYCKDQKSIPG